MEKEGATFKKHTSKHFLWNYLFYRYVVNMKDPSDYSGLEYSIATQIKEAQINWFPDNGPQEEGGELVVLVGDLESRMGEVGDNVSAFIDNYSAVVSTNTSRVKTVTEEFKRKIAEGGLMNEAEPLEQ
jgi:hypothetical protein